MVANSPNTWRNLEHMFQLFVGLFAVRRRPMDEPSATNGQRQECVAVDNVVNHATRITNIRGRKSIERALPSIRRAMIYQIFIAAVIGLTIKSPDLSMARWWRHVRIANNKQSNGISTSIFPSTWRFWQAAAMHAMAHTTSTNKQKREKSQFHNKILIWKLKIEFVRVERHRERKKSICELRKTNQKMKMNRSIHFYWRMWVEVKTPFGFHRRIRCSRSQRTSATSIERAGRKSALHLQDCNARNVLRIKIAFDVNTPLPSFVRPFRSSALPVLAITQIAFANRSTLKIKPNII